MLDICNYSAAPDTTVKTNEEPYKFMREYYSEQAREWDSMLEAIPRLLKWPSAIRAAIATCFALIFGALVAGLLT